jgi:hypothetical protein
MMAQQIGPVFPSSPRPIECVSELRSVFVVLRIVLLRKSLAKGPRLTPSRDSGPFLIWRLGIVSAPRGREFGDRPMKHRILAAVLSLAFVPAVQADDMPAPKSVDCVNLRDIDSTTVKDNKTIIFKMRGKKYYRNDLPSACPGLGFEKAFSLRTSTSQLCSVDIIYVLENYGGTLQQGAACGLGKFIEYTPPPKTQKPKG